MPPESEFDVFFTLANRNPAAFWREGLNALQRQPSNAKTKTASAERMNLADVAPLQPIRQ
jgi:hypothetical protein